MPLDINQSIALLSSLHPPRISCQQNDNSMPFPFIKEEKLPSPKINSYCNESVSLSYEILEHLICIVTSGLRRVRWLAENVCCNHMNY